MFLYNKNLITKAIEDNDYKSLSILSNKDISNFIYIYLIMDVSSKKNEKFLKDTFSKLSFLDRSYFFKGLISNVNKSLDAKKFELIMKDSLNIKESSSKNHLLETLIIKCCVETKSVEIMNKWLNFESVLFKKNNNIDCLKLNMKDLFFYLCNNCKDNDASIVLVNKILENKGLIPDYIIRESLSSTDDFNFFKNIYLKLNETEKRKYVKSIADFDFIKKRVVPFIEEIENELLKSKLTESVADKLNLRLNSVKRKI